MTIKHSPLAVMQILSNVGSRLSEATPFKLTLVKKRPTPIAQSKMIKLIRYDLHEELSPEREFDRIRKCLELPHLSIENNTTKADSPLAPHTLHMLIPLEELTHVSDYTKLLASIGYQSVINKGNLQLFVKKSESKYKTKVTIVQADDLQEDLLLRDLSYRHPGIQNTYIPMVVSPNQYVEDALHPPWDMNKSNLFSFLALKKAANSS